MTRYTKTMREAMEEVWANDITLSEGKMKTIATMFADGKSAEQIAKKMKLPIATVKTILGEDDIQEAMLWEFSDAQITHLQKEYAGLKGAKISLARANQLRNIFDKITNSQLPKLYKADIPFLSTMALSRMIKKGIQVPKGVRLSSFREETKEKNANAAVQVEEGTGTIRGFQNAKEKSNMVSLAKQHGLKVKDIPDGIELSGNMRKILDMQLATRSHLKTESRDYLFVEYAEYIEYMAKNSSQAKAIANMFKGKTGGGESKSDGSEVRIDSAKDVESIHKQVVAKYGDDVRVLTKEELSEKIQAYMISYSQYGKHYGFEGGDSLSDIQNKAQKLRAKGFTIDKMGRYNPPLDAKLRTGKTGVVEEKEEVKKEEPKKSLADMKKKTSTETKETDIDKIALAKEKDTDNLEKQLIAAQGQLALTKQKLENEKNKAVKPQPNKETGEVPLTIGLAHKLIRDKEEKNEKIKENFSVQITKTDGGKFIHGTYKTKAEAEKFIKWYKTGDLRKTKNIEVVKEKNEEVIGEAKYKYEIKISSDSGADGPDKEDEGTLQASSQQDAENKVEKKAIQFTKMWNKRKSPGNFSPVEYDVYKEDIIRRSFKSLRKKLQEATPDPITYGPDKVNKAMKIAVKSDGNYSNAVREIEKIAKDLSKVSTIARALKTANEDKEISERGGANTSSKQGSFAKSRKAKYRFGYRVAEKDPKGEKELEESSEDQIIKRINAWRQMQRTKVVLVKEPGNSGQAPYEIYQRDKLITRKHSLQAAIKYLQTDMEITREEVELEEANIVFKAKAKEGGYFLVLKRDTSGMSGSQDKFIMRHLKGNKVKELGSHPSLDGAKTFGKNKGIIEEVELEEIRIRPKRAVESDLSKSQTKKVHKKADDLPKKSFRDQYGKKKGDSVRYAVATKQTKKKIENKNHPAKKKWETMTSNKVNKDDNSKDILPKSQEPTQKTDPMNIQTKEPEKKRTDNGTKSDKIDVNPRIDYHA